jgi:acyl-CoA reductase-like NAD-dependent aldehyde dehydrogenase
MTRLEVRKTYKLWVGGAFVRSESGRYDHALLDGRELNIPRASRKDVRDAGAAARRAAGPWAARTAYNRGQILYRAAEALETSARGSPLAARSRRPSRTAPLRRLERQAPAVLGGINPVAAPFLSFSLPEPAGVVGIIAPDGPPLLGLIAELAPVLAAGNVAVTVLSESRQGYDEAVADSLQRIESVIELKRPGTRSALSVIQMMPSRRRMRRTIASDDA